MIRHWWQPLTDFYLLRISRIRSAARSDSPRSIRSSSKTKTALNSISVCIYRIKGIDNMRQYIIPAGAAVVVAVIEAIAVSERKKQKDDKAKCDAIVIRSIGISIEFCFQKNSGYFRQRRK